MLNKFEIIGRLEERNRAARHRPTSGITRSLSALRSSISYKYLLSMTITCLMGSLTTTIAFSQELPSDGSTAAAARFSGGWWPAEKAESGTAPQVVISMAEPTDLKTSDSLRTAVAEPHSDRQNQPTEAAIARLPQFGLTDGSVVMPSLLTDRISLAPASSFAFLQSEYSTGEPSLADSRSLTDEVNRVPVQPILQVNCAGWQLPVTLNTTSLRDGEAR
jgi:hypothetical protein